MKFVVILLGLCCCQQASGVTHTLQYFYTATSGIPNFPEFITMGVVDGQQIDHYDSITRKAIPKAEWITGAVDPDYFNRNTQTYAGNEPTFKANIDIARKRFNQSEGVHTWQNMCGCQWDDVSGAVDGFDQYGYDGEDFVSFDLKNMRFIATVSEGLITKHKWDNNRGFLETSKQYFNQICIDWLKKYVQYGSSTLKRKVPPEVTLIEKDSGVVCHSTGFYPEGVMITWKKDGVEIQEDVDVGETLPNEDGTFQKKVVLTVSPEERKKGQYTCEVAHKSGAPIVKTLPVVDGVTIIYVPIIICVIVAVVGVIVSIVAMKKNSECFDKALNKFKFFCKGYKKAEQRDLDSGTSKPIVRNGTERANC